MKRRMDEKKLLPLAVVSGVAALLLRQGLYHLAVDARGLLIRGSWMSMALGLVLGASMVALGIGVWPLGGSNRYRDSFRPSVIAWLGSLVGGAGLVLTAALLPPPEMESLATAWRVLGGVGGISLILAGLARYTGKVPCFLFYLLACLFLLGHLVGHYRSWCANPQTLDYLFQLLAGVAMMLMYYYQAAFSTNTGSRRRLLFSSLAAVVLCIPAMAGTDYTLLYLSGAVFAATNLCTMDPAPRGNWEVPRK